MVRTRGKALIVVVTLVVLTTALWIVSRPTEPRYQGKRLSHWLKGHCDCGFGPLEPEAVAAVRAIGTNAIPFLLEELQAKDLPWLPALEWIASKWPLEWSPPSASTHHARAINGFGILGQTAEPAIPALQQLMFGPDKRAGLSAQGALASIGGPKVFPIMLCGLTNMDLAPESACYFGRMRGQAEAAIPALVTNLVATNPAARKYVAFSLGQIGMLPETVVPALTSLLFDPVWEVRLNAISALAAFGQDAASALPILQLAADDSNRLVSYRARWALHRLQLQMRIGAIVRGPKASKTIALVFTGHEFAEGGETILDELTSRQVQASFFCTGDFMANVRFEPFLRRIINGGHLLGPHSDKHLLYCSWEADRKTLVTREQFRHDLEANRGKIHMATGRLAEGRLTEYPATDPEVAEAFKKRYGLPPDWFPPAVWGADSSSNLVAAPVCHYFLPPYEHYNREIADWTAEMGMTLINHTPGTRSHADYTGEADRNFVSSQAIFDSILRKEREDPNGLNGFILLLHIGAGPGRADKFHTRFGELLDVLAAKGYQFVRVDELLEPKETK